MPNDDLEVGEKVPNKSEVQVCGAISGRILRDSAEFKKLVKNSNSNIVFKQEEGSDADRMMTERLAEKANELAAAVMKEWPGKKLRITEAWDEQGEHSANSLHYEARAADMTVSDMDLRKLGRLGRLAVNAGFDWVLFEKNHVHASVKHGTGPVGLEEEDDVANVDLNASAKDRAKVLWALIEQVTDDMDQRDRLNIGRFMIHVAWHEGDRLKTREQYGGGPGRSFYQFEPVRAKEAVEYAERKGWVGKLSAAAGKTEREITYAAAQLATTGSKWPSGNLIEQILGTSDSTSDLFATYLIRIALKKIPQGIPSGNDKHAEYWADHWKRKFDSPADRRRLIGIVKTEADAVDRILDSL